MSEPLLLEGPRGSGKTTLLASEFPRRLYITLDDAADRRAARRDPSAFLARLRMAAILDDIHRAPELVAHLARESEPRPLLLASSRKLRLPLPTLRLYHPTRAEREGRPHLPAAMLGRFVPAESAAPRRAAAWPQRRRRVEGDIRDLVQLRDLDRFDNFLQLASQRSGAVLDVADLARAAGVSRTTAVRWLGVLDACFLTLRLEPYAEDFGRRLVRSPKLHFLDSPTFESAVVSEVYRNAVHSGETAELRHWRDSNGFEIPLVVETPSAGAIGVTIAESPTPVDEARVRRWMKLAGARTAALVSLRPTGRPGGPILRYHAAAL